MTTPTPDGTPADISGQEQTTTGATATTTSQIGESGSLMFPAVYYDAPVSQSVEVPLIGTEPPTAVITSGSAYFTVASSVVKTGQITPPPPSSDLPGGKHPGVVTGGPQLAFTGHVTVTVAVSRGASLQPGPITGTLEITYPRLIPGFTPEMVTVTETFALGATFYGTIIGTVSVTPPTVVPGQPVQIEVLNTLGEPISDPAVSVTVQAVPGASRWEQYATAGTRTLAAIASNGAITETATASVTVSGTALTFTLNPPSTKQLPIIEAAIVPGLPYTGSFTLGTPRSVSGTLVTAPPAQLVAPAADAGKAAQAVPAAGAGTPAAAATTAIDSAGSVATGAAAAGALVDTSYTWDFGDGSAPVTTQSPAVTHDFFPAITGNAVTHSFNVSCTAVHDNLTVQRTIVLHSAYGMCKQMGVVVPPITGAPTYAPPAAVSLAGILDPPPDTVPLNGFSASMIVHNLEPLPIEIQSVAIVPMSDTTSVDPPAPQFTPMSTPQTIAASSASALGTFVPLSALSLGGPPANAFTLYYLGNVTRQAAGTNTSVRFSAVFRISALYSGLTTPGSIVAAPVWNRGPSLEVLAKVTDAKSAAIAAGGGDLDAATRTITVPLAASANPNDASTVTQATSAVQTGLASIAAAAAPSTAALAAGGSTPGGEPASQTATVKDNLTINPADPPPVAPSATCYPDDISDADAASAAAQQLVCQLTSGPPETVTIPSAFQNAQAGDVILSPAPTGDGDLIAAMFQALTPPQHHGHSGIMTANFYELTHCTASVARIKANTNKDAAGIPTSLNGQMLQYGWPGSITQTIDEATNSVPWTAPEGAVYWEQSFNYDDRGSPQQLIPPLVIKPLPENEQTARPLLRQAADLARSKGARYASKFNLPVLKTPGEQLSIGGCYYSFYNYTKPQISAGFTDLAPAAAGWAQGTSPAVCSAFVWMCMKESGIPCVSANPTETLSDFTQQALATNEVAISPDPANPTLDGLIYYSQEERQRGGNALYNLLMEGALSQEYGLGTFPGINDTVAGPIADQLLNCFAFGDPNMVGQSNWQNPGVGNAVSPGNIALWSPPYFGYAEPLQYLPSHTDQYTPSEWVKVTTPPGTISGKVTRSDTGAPVAGALVWANLNIPGMSARSGADGSYTLATVPIGTYALKASATLTVGSIQEQFTNDQGVNYTLTAANNGNGVQDLVISPPLVVYRQINVQYQMSCDHGDDNPWNAHGVQTAGPYSRSLYVNPGHQTDAFTYTYDYNNGGYFHCAYTFSAALLEDGTTVLVTVDGAMYDDGSGNEQTNQALTPSPVIPAGGSGNWYIDMENSGSGYHNGPAHFTFTMENVQQTG